MEENRVHTDQPDMESARETIGRYAANHLELTQAEIDQRVERALALTRMGCAVIARIEEDSFLMCIEELSPPSCNPMKLCEALNREICIYDRHVKVNTGDEEAAREITIRHQAALDQAREALSRFKAPELDMDELVELIAELTALNTLYRHMNTGVIGALNASRERGPLPEVREDGEFVHRAMLTACMINLHERDILPPQFGELEKEAGGMDEKIALLICMLDRLGYMDEDCETMGSGGFQLSGKAKKLLLGAGALGALCMLLFCPHSILSKTCAGLAAVAVGVCAAAAIK